MAFFLEAIMFNEQSTGSGSLFKVSKDVKSPRPIWRSARARNRVDRKESKQGA
jgi:hypothetical protein